MSATLFTRFSGSVPENYDRYLGPMFFEPYAVDVASRILPAAVKTAVELCCGTGRMTCHLRAILQADATVVASDLSEEMIAIARTKTYAGPIDWRKIDAQRLPFDDNSVDLIVCCFGYMFVAEPVRAFAEAHRVLRPGGSLIFTTWDKLEHNGASNVFRSILKDFFGDLLPATLRAPYSMHDPSLIRAQLIEAGFRLFDIDLVEKNSECSSAREAAFGLVHGGSLYHEIVNRNASWLGDISAKVEKQLAEKYGLTPMVAPMRALITKAVK